MVLQIQTPHIQLTGWGEIGPPTRSRPSSFCNAVADLVAKAHWGYGSIHEEALCKNISFCDISCAYLGMPPMLYATLRFARASILSSNNPSAAADVWPKLCECDGRCEQSKDCSVMKAETVRMGAGPKIAIVLQCDLLPRTGAIRRRAVQRLGITRY